MRAFLTSSREDLHAAHFDFSSLGTGRPSRISTSRSIAASSRAVSSSVKTARAMPTRSMTNVVGTCATLHRRASSRAVPRDREARSDDARDLVGGRRVGVDRHGDDAQIVGAVAVGEARERYERVPRVRRPRGPEPHDGHVPDQRVRRDRAPFEVGTSELGRDARSRARRERERDEARRAHPSPRRAFARRRDRCRR